MAEYIKATYGEDKWEEIRRAAGVEQPSFSTHQVYPEGLIPRLSKKAVQVRHKLRNIILWFVKMLIFFPDIKSERKGVFRPDGRIFHRFREPIRLRPCPVRVGTTHARLSQRPGQFARIPKILLS